MLEELIMNRNVALEKYYLTESKLHLGLYNKALKELLDYCTDNSIDIPQPLDPLDEDIQKITRVKSNKVFDLTDVDVYNVDFEID